MEGWDGASPTNEKHVLFVSLGLSGVYSASQLQFFGTARTGGERFWGAEGLLLDLASTRDDGLTTALLDDLDGERDEVVVILTQHYSAMLSVQFFSN